VLQSIKKCDEAALAATLRDIRLFVAAYEERSFTAAAAREHATQSGVSQHIRKLEDALGVKLFSRNKSEVTPTPAGDSFYQRCLDVLRSHELATRTAKGYATGLTGEIVVGLMPTMTRCALAPALSAFVDTHPNTLVRIIEGYSAALTQQVRAGELDFAIVPAFSGMPGLKSRLFLRTPEVLVSGPSAPFEHMARACLASIGALKLVLPSKANTRRSLIETYCASNGVIIARILELDAMLGTLDFVARTDWMTILPGIMMAVDDPGGQLKVNPIHRPEFTLDLVLIEPSRRPMSDAASAFLELLQMEAIQLNGRWEAPPQAALRPH
jgi:LysR family nitrogen assimilation transcriptional regulator